MTIHHQMQEIALPKVRDPEALCCAFMTGILPQPENRPAGGDAASTTEGLAPTAFVQPSNGPTDIDADHWETGRPTDARGVGHATSSPPPADNEHPDPDIAHFYAELRRGLPEEYCFNEEQQVIFEPLRFQWLCGPIRVASYPRRVDGSGWCVHVEYLDRDGKLGRHTFPQVELNTGKGKHIADLIDKGMAIHAEPFWTTRVLRAWQDVPHGWRVDAAGWLTDPDGVTSFVRPDGHVHQPPDNSVTPVVHASPVAGGRRTAGSLAGWQEEVAAVAFGNPALIFAISAALAGPLLRWSGIDTAGFNFFGRSGVGKSLVLRLALGCGGDPSTLMPWAAAQTGLHRLSAESQDGLLALDAFPRDPESRHLKALLAIGDDAGAGRTLSPRDPDGGQRWRRVLLSSSELPLSVCLRRKRKDVPTALASRVIDLPAGADADGMIADLHGARDSTAFARRLEASLRRHHGHLLGAYLERLVADLPDIRVDLDHGPPELTRDIQDHCRADARTSPASRFAVAERFALVGCAGELAIRFGLLPWPLGSAELAARMMAARAYPGPEPATMDIESSLDLLRDHCTRHRDRIVDLPAGRPIETPPHTVGWRDEKHIYLQGEPIEQELDDPDMFWNTLIETAVLKPGGEQRSRQYKMPNGKVIGRPRCYRLDRSKIEG